MGHRCEMAHGKEDPEKIERGLRQEEAGKKALVGFWWSDQAGNTFEMVEIKLLVENWHRGGGREKEEGEGWKLRAGCVVIVDVAGMGVKKGKSESQAEVSHEGTDPPWRGCSMWKLTGFGVELDRS